MSGTLEFVWSRTISALVWWTRLLGMQLWSESTSWNRLYIYTSTVINPTIYTSTL